MKIGILQLSDLHIENDDCLNKVDAIVNACDYDIKQISHLYILITGDIAKNGRKAEYDKAKDFIISLQQKIKPSNSVLQIKCIMVPGNHDCCFDNVKTTRKTIINDCLNKDIIEEEDYFADVLTVQDNFWHFYEEINENMPTDKTSYKIECVPFINHKIVFHCYNTSWMSEIEEKYGGLIIPENKFINNNEGNITISLFHHPLNWLSPNTKNNNKARFEEHLINTSNIVLFGHEHDKGQFKNIQQKHNNVIFSESKALQKNKPDEEGFNYFDIDLLENKTTCKVFSWNKDNYLVEYEEKFSVVKKEKRVFLLTNEFAKKINTLKIPLKHYKKENLELPDVFVFPDLEPIKDDDTIQYTDSKDLLQLIKKEDKLKVVIEGDDQSGKTTLLFSFFKNLYDSGFVPIYIRGKHVNSTDIKSIVKRSIKEQYDSNNVDLFFQQTRIIVLFDNLQSTTLNPKYKATLLKNLDIQFDHIVITTSRSAISNLAVDEINILKNYDKYKLLSLGYQKRGELIEQWLRIGENVMTINEAEVLKSIQLRFDEVNSLIGKQLMPSYPIFVLTILQGLDAQIFQDFSPTSYAHCYHALITAGLVKEGLKNELTSYFNLLKELSYFLFEKKEDFFTVSTFENFYSKLSETYFLTHNSSQILRNLSNANILKFDDDCYSFSYKYIFYYLVAHKIANEIEQHESLITKLCKDIHLEENANILIFLSHHTKAHTLLDNIVFTSWLPFENVNPITLDIDDPFSTFISKFVSEIQGEMLKIEERNPNEEFRKEQERKDKIERSHNGNSENEYALPKEVVEINQALQTIKILGQIVKNQKGDFEKKKLIELVEAAYMGSFRLVNFLSGFFDNEKDSIIEAICDELEERNKNNLEFKVFLSKMGREEIKKQIAKFLQFISYSICIDSINNLIFAVGSQGIDELYNAVTEKIHTPIAKIVTFAIKSYYGSINIRELEALFKDVEKNHIAQNILRFYVKKHLYTNHIERTKKERIIRIAGFRSNMIIQKNN